MEPRNKQIWDADAVGAGGRQHGQGRYSRVPGRSHAVIDPEHAGKPFAQELRDLSGARSNAGWAAKANSHTAAIDAGEESDTSIVPAKSSNNGPHGLTERTEGREADAVWRDRFDVVGVREIFHLILGDLADWSNAVWRINSKCTLTMFSSFAY
jgi:hypothetical protein